MVEVSKEELKEWQDIMGMYCDQIMAADPQDHTLYSLIARMQELIDNG
jgi:hypothetical protein